MRCSPGYSSGPFNAGRRDGFAGAVEALVIQGNKFAGAVEVLKRLKLYVGLEISRVDGKRVWREVERQPIPPANDQGESEVTEAEEEGKRAIKMRWLVLLETRANDPC